MVPRPSERITAILLEPDSEGGSDRLDRLLPVVYDELREMAGRRLRSEAGVSLSPTELVHEAYVRLSDGTQVTKRGRAYFFASAARAMRRIVVDRARSRQRIKRGGGSRDVTLDEAIALMDGMDMEALDLDHALDALADVAERAARVVECRFFAGLSIEDTALALDITTRTVNRDWQFARAWLFDFLGGTSAGS